MKGAIIKPDKITSWKKNISASLLEQHNDALQDTLPLRIRRRFDCSFLKIPNAFWLNKRIKADVEGSFNINASFLLTVDQLDQVVAHNPITDRCLRAQSRKRIYSKSTQTARHIVDSVISGRSCCLPTRHQCHSGLMTSYKDSTGAIGYTATRKWSNYFIAIRAVRQRHDVTDDVRFRGWLAASSDADWLLMTIIQRYSVLRMSSGRRCTKIIPIASL